MNQINKSQKITKGTVRASDPVQAAEQLSKVLGSRDFAAIFFFTATELDFPDFGLALSKFYPETKIFGCTSSGIIGDQGYMEQGITAFALPKSQFRVDHETLFDLPKLNISQWRQKTKSLVARFSSGGAKNLDGSTFGFLLIDGLSLCEDSVLSAVYPEFGDIPLFGGSAGDNLKFENTFIFADGQAHQNSALVILIKTTCPFHVFRTDHFEETARKMIITQADPASRIVNEINASPAAEEYARLIGVPVKDLNAMMFAAHPVMVRVAGSYFVRSIQRQEGGDGLRFFCAIDEGLVLTLAKSMDIVSNLQETFNKIHTEIGQPELVIGCDCIFRKLELDQSLDKKSQISDILKQNRVFGFNTYGEQFAGMHVNQTFTGVAIGWGKEHD